MGKKTQKLWFPLFKKRFVALTKAFLLLILVFIVTVVCFVMGLATLGLMWPKKIRYFVFGSNAYKDNEENSNSELELEISELLRKNATLISSIKSMSKKKRDNEN